MVTSSELIKRFGDPTRETLMWERHNMVSWSIPKTILNNISCLPNKLYINKRFIASVENWFNDLIQNDVYLEIKTFDGCFNIRKKRASRSLSIHSFGMAIDLNAAHNPFNHTRDQCIYKGLKPFTSKFIEVSRKHVDCGADWKNPPDLMHFQIKRDRV